jgi:hypothetical protein
MTRTGLLLGCLLAPVAAAAAPPGTPAMPGPAAMPGSMGAPPAPARIVLADVVDPAYRDAVVSIARKPTLSTRATSEEVVCSPALYEWLLEHPDRVVQAWKRMKTPCLDVTDLGNGRFWWTDGEGSEIGWQVVGRFKDGLVWYATGKVKPSPVAPTVPVRAVVVLLHPNRPLADGSAVIRPFVQVYVNTDSRVANVVLKALGPTAPKLAEQAAEQLLYFFNGVAKQAHAKPDQAEALLAPARK